MPGGDRTGPRGEGPRTGRKAGFCSGSKVPGYANREFWPALRSKFTSVGSPRRGRGREGRARGRRSRRW